MLLVTITKIIIMVMIKTKIVKKIDDNVIIIMVVSITTINITRTTLTVIILLPYHLCC